MQPAASSTLDPVLQDVKILAKQLLAASCSPVSEIPASQGVYLIYERVPRQSTSAKRRT
jgi:hypothetical protein